MTTLAENTPRNFEIGERNEFPMIASDIIYEGSAVGAVIASGHARPLTSVDRFVGFAEAPADNSAGAAAAINVRVIEEGKAQLSVTGAVITDVGQPVYAQDDNAFSFIKTAGVFIGFVHRFVSSGVVVVKFNAGVYVDPWEGFLAETLSGTKTLDIQDTGKVFFVDTDAFVTTLLTYAAGTAITCAFVNAGAYGTILVSIDPAAGDKISGPDDTGADGGLLDNTKTTAQRGDFSILHTGGDDGYIITGQRGTWTIA
jgi:hypothetical protein